MPKCDECGITQATAEMRHSKKVGMDWVCKDTPPCKERKKERKIAAKARTNRTERRQTISSRTHCPRCRRKLQTHRREGIFRWKVCPARKTCGWTVFTHGQDPHDDESSQE